MIGRSVERAYIDTLMASKEAHMLAIVGRRRVGKTYLVRQHLGAVLDFEFVGTQHATKRQQLVKFSEKLGSYMAPGLKPATASSWDQAFAQLRAYLSGLRKVKRKRVIFLDELPWMASHRSGFLQEFTYWWNDWASRQNILVIICGSAASWMLTKVVDNKGGLHNRVTARIDLKPFTLAETREMLHQANPALTHYEVIKLYMAVGGIPHYLQHLKRGESATQCIDRLCFHKDGPLRREFDNLYAALFDDHERHVEVIRALSTKWKGLTRHEIIDNTTHTNGGGLSKILTDLEASTFITTIHPFQKKKRDTLYRLTDEYSLFYLRFIEGQRPGKKDVWLQQSTDNSYKAWRGYAFENLCIKHVEAIKMALSIAGIHSQASSYLARHPETGSVIQIDMLIDRADRSINLCEMKFYNADLVVTAEMAKQLRTRRARFIELSRTRKTVFNTLVTTYGVANSGGIPEVDHCITMDQLFLLQAFG